MSGVPNQTTRASPVSSNAGGPGSPSNSRQAAPLRKPSISGQSSAASAAAAAVAAAAVSGNLNISTPQHQRQSSIADILSTPPPLSSEAIARRSSIASSDDGNSSTSNVSNAPAPRDWQDVPLSELVQRENLVSVDGSTSVEKAFDILVQHGFTSLPIRYNDTALSHTFDYSDLCAYLLLVLGHIEPSQNTEEIQQQVQRARSGQEVPVKFVAQLGTKDPFITVSAAATISSAVEILGGGVHRIAISDSVDPKIIVGILSQRRLIRYIWENGRLFKSLETLFQTPLSELHIGSKEVISITGDKLVIDALKKMHDVNVSSLAVVDHSQNLLGNISIVDVRLVSKSSQSALLKYSCKQFLSVILSRRGLEDGKDSFPVFHVTMDSTLGRTIAKLVATKAHRLWIVQPKPTEDLIGPSNVAGQLTGVVSLTDILYVLAKRAGKEDMDPSSARRQRRRSSSSSVRSQPSYDAFRRSLSTDRHNR